MKSSHVVASNEESHMATLEKKTHGMFLLNARPKLRSNLNLNSKFAVFFFYFLIYEKVSIKPEKEPQQGSNNSTKL